MKLTPLTTAYTKRLLRGRSIIVLNRADAAVLREQGVPAVAEQVEEEGVADLLLAVADWTSMVIVVVVAPGANVTVPVFAT
jgi:hypothetical protein